MLVAIILLLVGFVLLIKGADFFVDGSSSIAKTFKIPPVIIGLTIVALGTSAPEAAVSIQAALKGDNAISVSNVIGSNIFNLLMVVGVCAAIKAMPVDKSILRRDFPICILVTGLMLYMLSDKQVSRIEGLILLGIFVIYLIIIVIAAIRNKTTSEDEIKALPVWKAILFILIGLLGIVYGGQLVVDYASEIAKKLGMSQTLIGLTIVALGTSLPELVTSVVACHKGSNGLALGNVVGSNICNILFVLAASSSISPMKGLSLDCLIDAACCLFVTIVMYLMVVRDKKYSRKEGFCCILIYLLYTAYIILRNYDMLPF